MVGHFQLIQSDVWLKYVSRKVSFLAGNHHTQNYDGLSYHDKQNCVHETHTLKTHFLQGEWILFLFQCHVNTHHIES